MNARRWVLLAGVIVAGLVPQSTRGQCPGSESPADICTAARLIPGLPGEYEVFMDVSTATGSETLCGASTGKTVWFDVTPTASGTLTFSTCLPSTTYDTVVTAYAGGDSMCDSMSQVACNDDTVTSECSNGCSGYGSIVTITATAGTRYRFVVGAYNDNGAGCNLCLGVRVTVPGAVDNSWIGTGTGWWEGAGNWSLGVAPSRSHSCYITNANTKTVRLYDGGVPDTVKTISNLVVSAPLGSTNTFQLEDITSGKNEFRILESLWVNPGGSLVLLGSTQHVGQVDTSSGFWIGGNVLVDGGVLNSTNAGHWVNYDGQITVSNGTWLGGPLWMGSDSRGTLSVAGGTCSLGGVWAGDGSGTGTVWVTGGRLVNEGIWLGGGPNGVGRVEVSNGVWQTQYVGLGADSGGMGIVRIAGGTNDLGAMSVADHNNATGTVWLMGGQLTVTNDPTTIGYQGTGQMTVSNGLWQAEEVNIGFDQPSQGVLSIVGGTNVVSGDLSLGVFWATGYASGAKGELVLKDGLLIVTNGQTIVGVRGNGSATVSNGTFLARDVIVGSNTAPMSGSLGGVFTVAGGTNSLRSLTVGYETNGIGVVTLTGGTLTVTNDVTVIGHAGTGQMTVSNGTLRFGHTHVGYLASSRGTLTVNGANSAVLKSLTVGTAPWATGTVWVAGQSLDLTVTDLVNVGWQGTGRMTVSNATVRTGSVSVGNASSPGGTYGFLRVAGTGAFVASSSLSLGNTVGALGELWVDGGQLTVTNGDTSIGFTGNGRLTISNGVVRLRDVQVSQPGIGSASTLTVAGGWVEVNSLAALNSAGQVFVRAGTLVSHGTAITNGASFVVGDSGGTANLNLGGGLHGLALGVTAGGSAGSTGTVWASNCQLLASTAVTRLGDHGAGRLVLSNATAQVGTLQMGWWPDANGSVVVAGGTLTANAWATLGDDAGSVGEFTLQSGAFTVTNDTTYIGGRYGAGVGRLTLSNGVVRTRDVQLGPTIGSQGYLAVRGGQYQANTGIILGGSACVGYGQVDISTGNLFVTNAAYTATLEVRTGIVLQSGGNVTIDRLVITNACGYFVRSGGNLVVTYPPVLTPGYDADNDGLLNGWEQANHLDPFKPTGVDGPAGDPDGDEHTNLQEQAAGTDPWDANSNLHITAITREGNDIRVTWSCVGNHGYRLQTNAVPTSAGFADLGQLVTVPNGFAVATTNYLHTGGATLPKHYYRVRLGP